MLVVRAPWVNLPEEFEIWDTPGWDTQRFKALISYAFEQANSVALANGDMPLTESLLIN